MLLHYDEPTLEELRHVYGHGLGSLLFSLGSPPRRYYVRVNVLRAQPGEVLDEMRSMGLRVYSDEYWEEALWLPVEGPNALHDTGCHVFVDKRTAESVMMGAHVYAPGVVSVEECVQPGVEVTVATVEGIVVANGVVSAGFRDALSRRRGLVVDVIRPLYRVPSLRETPWYRGGVIYEQSISSMTVGRMLSPRPGSVIVDMCAAPGGKTGHVYEMIKGRARVIAVDHSKKKIARMREEMKRLGHSGVEILHADARRLPEILGQGIADYVVLDPPCSSLGVIPKVYDRKSYREITTLARYQRSLLRAAGALLKPGGVMVYSTCTMTITENEANIEYAVEKLGLHLEESWPRRWSRGIGAYGVYAQRVHPSIHGATGYFVARLRR